MLRRLTTLVILAFPTAVAAQALGVPNAQTQAPRGAPVQIEDCTAQASDELVQRSNGRFGIAFTNEGTATADLVKFKVDFGQESMLIRDAGTFAPGVTVHHVYKRRGGTVYSIPLIDEAKLVCSVDAVHFSDGSTWTRSGEATSSVTTAADGKGYLGVQMSQAAEAVVIRFLVPSGPARLAGLQQDDAITTIDGQRVSTIDQAAALIEASAPGVRLAVGYSRAGVPGETSVVVGRLPTTVPLNAH